MGIDKLRLLAQQVPCADFLNLVNQDLGRPKEEQMFKVQFRNPREMKIQPDSFCSISTKKWVLPGFFCQLNFSAYHGGPIMNVLELNPNKLPNGYRDMASIMETIFGEISIDPKISRIDLNADIELPVDFFYRTLRVPWKRKRNCFAEIPGNQVAAYCNRGITGFYVGAKPGFLRIYDKREEMKKSRENVADLPKWVTRLEWELRHDKCPAQWISEIEVISDLRPFDSIEILESDESYDFHYDPSNSFRKFSFKKLSDEFGSQEAARIINAQRNFKRDFRGLLIDNSNVKERLNESFRKGTEMFFQNIGADFHLKETIC